MKVTYTLSVTQDDIPVRGNAIDSGNAATDKDIEDEILERLDRGDVWAWALVKVTAECEGFDGFGFSYLGGCSYKDEKEFREDSYFEDLKTSALDDLISNMKASIKNGKDAARLLKTIK